MKLERDAGTDSKYRVASVEENLARLELMMQGLKEPIAKVADKKEEEKKTFGSKQDHKKVE